MNITVRQATLQDADHVAQLWQELIHHHLEYDPYFKIKADATIGVADHLGNVVQDPSGLLFVAESVSTLVGFVHGSVLKRPPCFVVPKQGQIWDLFVSEHCRRQGIG